MKHSSCLSERDQAALEQMHISSKTARQRQRAHAVLLSASGYKLDLPAKTHARFAASAMHLKKPLTP